MPVEDVIAELENLRAIHEDRRADFEERIAALARRCVPLPEARPAQGRPRAGGLRGVVRGGHRRAERLARESPAGSVPERGPPGDDGRRAHHRERPPGEVLSAESVRAVFGLAARVVEDPVSGTPMIIPLGGLRGRSASDGSA